MRIENSPEYEAEMRERMEKRETKRRRLKEGLETIRNRWRESGFPWMPMEDCPFKALDESYGYDGTILVADGEKVVVAKIKRRFGTPIFWKVEPEMIWRDGTPTLVGGERDPRDDLPKWWWKWEITDELESETWAYGEPAGQPEIDFVPTLWSFLPEPLKQ